MKLLLILLVCAYVAFARELPGISDEDRRLALEAKPQYLAFDVNNPRRLNDTQHAILYALLDCEEKASLDCDTLESYTKYVLESGPGRVLSDKLVEEAAMAHLDFYTYGVTHTRLLDTNIEAILSVGYDCESIPTLNIFDPQGHATVTTMRVNMCNALRRHSAAVLKDAKFWSQIKLSAILGVIVWFGQVIYYLLSPIFNVLAEYFAVPHYIATVSSIF